MNEEKNMPEEKSQPLKPDDLEVPNRNHPLLPETSHTHSEKTLEPIEAQLSDIESQTETMEVHHHGHVHEKKKWKEYLFQFFMLFLAVFCGFLAEY